MEMCYAKHALLGHGPLVVPRSVLHVTRERTRVRRQLIATSVVQVSHHHPPPLSLSVITIAPLGWRST